ncbi:MAG: sodium:solute symporter family protein [bacterium]
MSDRLILWAIVIGYMVFIFVKGVSKARNIGDADDFLVAGRNVGWFFLFCTMGATVIGGGASIGAIGKTYDWGVLMLLVSTGWYLQFIFAGLVVAPKFRDAELYTVAGYFGHRFGEGPRFLMLILSLLFSVFIVAAQMAAFGSVMAAILPQFADAAYVLKWAILIGGSMVVIYSTAGGLLAVIHTDVYQFIVLMLGFIITLGFCIPDIEQSYNPATQQYVPTRFSAIDLQDSGSLALKLRDASDPVSQHLRGMLSKKTLTTLGDYSGAGEPSKPLKQRLINDINKIVTSGETLYDPAIFADVSLTSQTRALLAENPKGNSRSRLHLSLIQDAYPQEFTQNRHIPDSFFRVTGDKSWLFLITTFLAFLFGETFAPGYATRYCVGKDIKQTKWGISGVGFFLAGTFPVILFFIALYARIHFPDIEPQQALPLVVRELNNPVVGGLMIGALLMAVMSSADSALNSSTAIFVKDLFEHQLGWEDKGDGRTLRLARICSLALGGTAILIAVLWSDIIGLLLFTYHVWAPAVILPVCVGALSKHRSRLMTTHIFITMIVATAATLVYRFLLLFTNRFDWTFFSGGIQNFMERCDPSVFGVAVSCLVFFSLRLVSRMRQNPS